MKPTNPLFWALCLFGLWLSLLLVWLGLYRVQRLVECHPRDL